MDYEKITVYTASSVNLDYFNFLNKTIENAGYRVVPLYLIKEHEYRQYAKDSGFWKVWLRIKMYFLYPLYLIFKGCFSRSNSIFVISSNTFFAPFLMQMIARFKKSEVIHLLYDLYPDALEVAQKIEKGSLKSWLIGKIFSRSQKIGSATVYLGHYLMEHAEQRWGKAKESLVIDISTDMSLYECTDFNFHSDEKLIIHYGGQLGHLHDSESVIQAVKYIENSDLQSKVEFVFYVSGSQAPYLKSSLKGYPVKIISAISSQQWRLDIRKFHVGLVSLSPGGATVCLPSKSYAMMAGGMAILAICPAWSDLAGLIKKLDCGWVVNNADLNEKQIVDLESDLNNVQAERNRLEICLDFYNTVKYITENNYELMSKRENAFHGVRKNFDISHLSTKWSSLIMKIRDRQSLQDR